MTTSFGLPRKLLILGLTLPVAILLGFMLASPFDLDSIAVVGLVIGILAVPVILEHHLAFLLFSFNASIDLAFLPGRPHLWMLLALITLGLSLTNRILNKESRLQWSPSVAWSLAAFVAVCLVTARLTGGFGLRTLGGSIYGGKKYYYILFALLVMLAVGFQKIPFAKAERFVGLYLLSSLCAVIPNLAYSAGDAFWWLYYVFPVDNAMAQATEDFSLSYTEARFGRQVGLSVASVAIIQYLLARFGIRGLLDANRPWRLALVVVLACASTFGGFRSSVVAILLLFFFQFIFEGLLRTRLFVAVVVAGVLGLAALYPIANRLPLSVQRSLSVLPYLQVNAGARADALASSSWRFEMWAVLWKTVPKYFWLGKGFTATETDYYLAKESERRGILAGYELSILAGDYHSGPLSILIPFGIFGVLTYVFFLAMAGRAIFANYMRGPPHLKRINTMLMSMFAMKVTYFIAIFGAVHLDVITIATLVGLSISLNHGVAPKPAPGQLQPIVEPATN